MRQDAPDELERKIYNKCLRYVRQSNAMYYYTIFFVKNFDQWSHFRKVLNSLHKSDICSYLLNFLVFFGVECCTIKHPSLILPFFTIIPPENWEKKEKYLPLRRKMLIFNIHFCKISTI